MGKQTVWCTTQFEAEHRWDAAPDEVRFLRNEHHHTFMVRVEVAVQHDDRAVEFIILKRMVDNVIGYTLVDQDVSRWSCEQWCSAISSELIEQHGLDVYSISVSEEGVHGSTLHFT